VQQFHHPLFVILGPSGAGKSTLIAMLLAVVGDLRRARSHTSRSRREGESEDAYFFDGFEILSSMIERGEFVEYDQPFLQAETPVNTIYGRSAKSFEPLARGPCIADMTEPGLVALRKLDLAPIVAVRIVPKNHVLLPHAEERSRADKARAQIEVAIDHVIENDHADPKGLQNAYEALLEIVLAKIVPNYTSTPSV